MCKLGDAQRVQVDSRGEENISASSHRKVSGDTSMVLRSSGSKPRLVGTAQDMTCALPSLNPNYF